MADLRVKKQGTGEQTLGQGRFVVPLWPFLLLILALIVALLIWWPQQRQESVTFFNPVSGQNQVLTYASRRFAPVPDAVHHQVSARPQDMAEVGRANGQAIYAPRRGGGGGVPGAGLYLRTGNDLFVPLREVR